jgi:hypothetical protein
MSKEWDSDLSLMPNMVEATSVKTASVPMLDVDHQIELPAHKMLSAYAAH